MSATAAKITRKRCSVSCCHWQQQQQHKHKQQSPAVFASFRRSTNIDYNNNNNADTSITSNNCSGRSSTAVARSFRRDENHRNHQFQTNILFATQRRRRRREKTDVVVTASSSSSSSFLEQLFPRHAASVAVSAPLPVRIHDHYFPSGNYISFFPNGLLPVHNHHHRYDRERQPRRRRYFSSYTGGSSSSTIESRRKRSPYAVLGLRKKNNKGTTTITKETIKVAFRNLAKVYHPDLNPDNRPREECEVLMSELVEAYERLLKHDDGDDDDSDFLENIRVGASNKVALACELYSVDELIMDRFHEVHALRMKYYDSDDDENEIESGSQLEDEKTTNGGNRGGEDDSTNSNSLPVSATATPFAAAIPFKAHPGDSVSDLKGRLESSSEFGIQDWGLTDCLGWELLALTRNRNKDNISLREHDDDDEDPTIVAANNEVLSYHLFLDDYQIQHGDIIYAVVRKNDN